jgi:hypothetical protein
MRARTETLTDVPDDLLNEVVASFASDHASRIEKRRQPDGRWTVVATFDLNEEARRLKAAHPR